MASYGTPTAEGVGAFQGLSSQVSFGPGKPPCTGSQKTPVLLAFARFSFLPLSFRVLLGLAVRTASLLVQVWPSSVNSGSLTFFRAKYS